MRVLSTTVQSRAGRSQAGSQIAEFMPALIILALFVFIPLLDLSIVPVRWMLAQQLVNEYSRKLALCDSFSQAWQTMEADPSLATRLQKLGGIAVQSVKLHLLVSRVFRSPHAQECTIVDNPGQIPDAWLPDGAKSPCSYSLQLDVQSLMSPAIVFHLADCAIPGLTTPIPLLVSSSHAWENLGRDPISRRFFVNE